MTIGTDSTATVSVRTVTWITAPRLGVGRTTHDTATQTTWIRLSTGLPVYFGSTVRMMCDSSISNVMCDSSSTVMCDLRVVVM